MNGCPTWDTINRQCLRPAGHTGRHKFKGSKRSKSPLLEKAMGAVDETIKREFGLREFVVKESDVRIVDKEGPPEFVVTLRIVPNPLLKHSIFGG